MHKQEVIEKMQEYLNSNVTIKVGANPIVNTATEKAVDIIQQEDISGLFFDESVDTRDFKIQVKDLHNVYFNLNNRMSASGLKKVEFLKLLEQKGITINRDMILAKAKEVDAVEEEVEQSLSLWIGSAIDNAIFTDGNNLRYMYCYPPELVARIDSMGLTPTEKRIINSNLPPMEAYCSEYNNADTRVITELLNRPLNRTQIAPQWSKSETTVWEKIQKNIENILAKAEPLRILQEWKADKIELTPQGKTPVFLDEVNDLTKPIETRTVIQKAYELVNKTYPKTDLTFDQLGILWDFYLYYPGETHTVNMKSLIDRLEFITDDEGNIIKIRIIDWKTKSDIVTDFVRTNYKKYKYYKQLAIYRKAVLELLRNIMPDLKEIISSSPHLIEIEHIIVAIEYNITTTDVVLTEYKISENDILAALYGGFLIPSFSTHYNKNGEIKIFLSGNQETKLKELEFLDDDVRQIGIGETLSWYHKAIN